MSPGENPGRRPGRPATEEDDRHGFSLESPVLRHALTSMDAWLTSLTSDHSSRPAAQKVVANKPTGLTDACWTPEPEPRKITQKLTFDNRGRCGELHPAFPTPRLVAGAPVADDVVKCERKPVSADDYGVDFTRQELLELRRIFPTGVCDWSGKGEWRKPLAGTWRGVR